MPDATAVEREQYKDQLRRIEAACGRSEAWGGATPNEHALADIAAITGESNLDESELTDG